MTNEQKAKRLEEIAERCRLGKDVAIIPHDADLLYESAQMLRERDGVRWKRYSIDEYICIRNGHVLTVKDTGIDWRWQVTKDWATIQRSFHPTLDAAKQAAIAWVDAQEAR